jgi:hypothetical protein
MIHDTIIISWISHYALAIFNTAIKQVLHFIFNFNIFQANHISHYRYYNNK